ncbi:hypothetical protein WL12_08740 [Burkholderia ubonensis]|nr:hypothetical protein WL12_08740 [Burkholderia ubonensis]
MTAIFSLAVSALLSALQCITLFDLPCPCEQLGAECKGTLARIGGTRSARPALAEFHYHLR